MDGERSKAVTPPPSQASPTFHCCVELARTEEGNSAISRAFLGNIPKEARSVEGAARASFAAPNKLVKIRSFITSFEIASAWHKIRNKTVGSLMMVERAHKEAFM